MAATLYKSFGPKLVGQGYDITPVVGKKPILEAWTTRPGAALDYTLHSEKSIGVLLGGRHNLVAVDVDVLNPFCSNDLEKLVEEELGSAPKRIGKAPKFLMLFRCTELQKKIRTGVYEIDGVDAATELLGEGQQFVAAGVHPDTGSRYVWPGDKLIDIAPEELTEVTPDALRRFLAMASSVMATYGELKGRVSDRGLTTAQQSGLNLKELRGKAAEVEAAVMHIPNDDEHYDDWVQTAHAIKGAIGDSGFDLFCRWSARSAKDDPAQNERLWQSIGAVKHIGAGSLYHWAGQYGFDLATYREPQHVGPKDAPAQADDGLDEWESVDEDGVISIVSPKLNDLSGLIRASEIRGPIPDREWLLDQWFPAKSVSMLFGQGGVGKTLLIHQLANCVATGADFIGFETRKMPVLMVLCEDDQTELSRRQLSINAWLEVNDVTGRGPEDLYIWPRVGEDNVLVTFPSQGEDKPGAFYGELVAAVEHVKEKTGADELLVILDTAADMFGGNENIRREVNTFIKTYCGSFCVRHNATVIVLAHPSVAGVASGTGMSGSTAWENSARARAYFSRDPDGDNAIRTLSRMKSNYSVSGKETDITLMWDEGVYQLPTTPDQVDRLEKRGLKNAILTEIECAYIDKNPYTQRGARSAKIALPRHVNASARDVAIALNELHADGFLSYETRTGWKVEKSPI